MASELLGKPASRDGHGILFLDRGYRAQLVVTNL